MNIAFVDLSPIDYTVVTPFRRPLGGMQSGLCYLATELARRGHAVRLLNRTTSPGEALGVRCEAIDLEGIADQLADVDCVVSIHCDAAQRIRPFARRLILWTGHNVDEPTMAQLRDVSRASLWDHFVFKSEWQARRYLAETAVDPARCHVIGNAVSPAFLQSASRTEFFFEQQRDPVLHYSSTPFRGLGLLVRAFPFIRQQVPGCTLRVYSSMDVYQEGDDADPHTALYDLCRNTPGVSYRGSVPQPELADAVRSSDILAYPSTFAETSCVTLMEAMTAGCLTVTSSLGALPETSAGYGFFVELARSKPVDMVQGFAKGVLGAIHVARSRPKEMRSRLLAQSAHARRVFDWRLRADEWGRLLTDMCRSPDLVIRAPGSADTGQRSPDPAAKESDAGAGLSWVTTRSGRRIHCDPSDARARRLHAARGDFNPLTSAVWRTLLGLRKWTHVFDVGANYGEMLVDVEFPPDARVMAFEPNPAVLPFLRRTLAELGKVELVEAAVSSRSGELPFVVDRQWSGMSRVDPDALTPFRVPAVTLDSVLEGDGCPLPQAALLLKIDVEGHERAVLEGARQSIGRLGAFAALIEIAHLDDDDRTWLSRNFRVAGLCLRTRRLVELEDLSPQRLAELAVHDQDVAILRRPRRS